MRTAIWILAAALVLSNVAWMYVLLDRSVTHEHQSDELVRRERVSELLRTLVVELPSAATQQEAYRLLEQRHPDLPLKIRGDTLEAGEVLLEFRGDSLARVSIM